MCIFETQQLVTTHRGTVMHLAMPEPAASSSGLKTDHTFPITAPFQQTAAGTGPHMLS